VTDQAARPALLVVALFVGAWLALGLRADVLESEGERALARATIGPVPPEDVVEARHSLARARRFNPDQEPRIIESRLLIRVGRTKEGGIVARRVIAEEPENALGWYLAFVSSSPGIRQAALQRVGELNPWLADSLR
jgi:hypothetical protein